MKPIHAYLGSLAMTLAIAACVPKAAPPVLQTRLPSAPPPAPAPSPIYDSWMDAPQTPGDWTYRAQAGDGVALFGESASEPRFSLRCDRTSRAVILSRAGQLGDAREMTVRTESQSRRLAASSASNPIAAVESRLAANDRLLDAMALSKGRFAIEVPGTTTLYLPSWAEVTRVIEDCR